jgi:hypothetical protein
MVSVLRFLRRAALALAAMTIVGCATTPAAGDRAAVPVAWIDGKHVVLSPTEIARIRPDLVPLLEQRGLVLVSDLSSADLLVTIRYEPNPAVAESTAVHIVSLSENRLRSQRAMGQNEMDNSMDASRSAASSFPGGIGTAEPSRSR